MADLIGAPIDRIDGRAKVTGRATYAYEHKIPNVAYGVLTLSTIAKGKIASIDTRAAEKVPGVLLVLTYQNATKLKNPLNEPAPGQERTPARAITALQDNLVRYAGQPVALAVAETLQAAQEAAQLIQVQYQAEAHEVDLEARMAQAYAPKKAGGGGDPATSKRGDVENGMGEADERLEQVYWTPFEVHNPMEPHATIAVWDDPDHLTLYDATQGVFSDRQRIAGLFNLKQENVRVISPYLGGGFGSKGPVWSHVALCAMAAKQVNRPVKLAVERPQMFGMLGLRSQTRQSLRIGAKRDGTLTALSNDTISHTSTFDEFVESSSLAARMLYKAPNNSTSQKLVTSDIGTPSFMRAPGEATGTYALEAAMDEMAYALKMDPVEFRLKNYADINPQEDKPWSSKSLRDCYRMGAERFGWSKRTIEPRSMRDGHTLIGWGMATAEYPTRRSASNAIARLNADGTFFVDAGTQDLGTGTYTIMTQIAADSFGVGTQQIKFRLGDTILPQTPVSGGSQTAASTGSAVKLASQALREKLVQVAVSDAQSPLSGVNEGDVILDKGRLYAKGNPLQGETFQQLLARQKQPYLEAKGEAKPGDEKEEYSMYSFGAQFAEVRVDEELGQMKVSRMTGCFAAGKILNAKTARSQFLGGMAWA